jgi:hypothetical protein
MVLDTSSVLQLVLVPRRVFVNIRLTSDYQILSSVMLLLGVPRRTVILRFLVSLSGPSGASFRTD